MTNLVRLILIIGVLAGIVYGGLALLAALVEPQQREISVTAPLGRIGQ